MEAAQVGQGREGRVKPPLIALRWMDAHGTATNTYETHELPHKALEITTYGLLLRDDADGVSIANEDCGSGCYRGVTFVPRVLIVEIKHLTRARKKREQQHEQSGVRVVTGRDQASAR